MVEIKARTLSHQTTQLSHKHPRKLLAGIGRVGPRGERGPNCPHAKERGSDAGFLKTLELISLRPWVADFGAKTFLLH